MNQNAFIEAAKIILYSNSSLAIYDNSVIRSTTTSSCHVETDGNPNLYQCIDPEFQDPKMT